MVNIIAEIGINHNGCINTCLEMIKAAKDSGADYVKFQKRNPDVCVPEAQKSKMRSTPWGDMTYLEYKHRIEFGLKEYEVIDDYCKSIDIGWFVSVWDTSSVRYMEHFNNGLVKVPSAKADDLELIQLCKDTFDHVIVSTGMCTQQQIFNILDLYSDSTEKNDLSIFHTVSAYPVQTDSLRMDTITWLKSFGFSVGFSSHETSLLPASASVFKGVDWIERHFTFDKDMWGTDQKASSDPKEMQLLVSNVRVLEKALGVREGVLECEKENMKKMR
jgi:sialic acid synthase SpsE